MRTLGDSDLSLAVWWELFNNPTIVSYVCGEDGSVVYTEAGVTLLARMSR